MRDKHFDSDAENRTKKGEGKFLTTNLSLIFNYVFKAIFFNSCFAVLWPIFPFLWQTDTNFAFAKIFIRENNSLAVEFKRFKLVFVDYSARTAGRCRDKHLISSNNYLPNFSVDLFYNMFDFYLDIIVPYFPLYF